MKIKEETIEKHQYFTTNGYDIWLINPLRMVQLRNLATGETEDLVVGQESRFLPIRMPKIPMAKPPVKNKKPRQSRKKPSGRKRGPRASGRTSKYKCVSKMGEKWRAQIWDKDNNKPKHLGSWKIEELAAAAVAEHKGDMAEAERLRKLAQQIAADMAEQAENNPDRPVGRRRKKTWLCKACNIKYRHNKKPLFCPGCNGTTFEEVKEEEE